MNLIISQERSLNKAQGLLHHFHKNCVLIIDRLPEINEKKYILNAASIIISKEFELTDIISKVSTCSAVWCVSENLLPLAAKIEKIFNIHNISESAANILSNKYEFDQLCVKIGHSSFVPKSIIPKSLNDLYYFGNSPILVKATCGAGGNVFFPGDNQNNPRFEFRRWNNVSQFIQYMRAENLLDHFFYINSNGIQKNNFSMKKAYFLVQEFCPTNDPCFVTTGFVRNGKVEISLLSKMAKAPILYDHKKSVIDNHAPSEIITRDSAIWTITPSEISPNVYSKIYNFLQDIIDELKISTMFFSGPDFHISGEELKAIDFNPRPSGWLNLINDKMGMTLIPSIITGGFTNFSMLPNYYLWGCLHARSGVIKNFQPPQSLLQNFNTENSKIGNGTNVPEYINLQNKNFNINVTITSDSQKKLIADYETANQLFQDSIEYY